MDNFRENAAVKEEVSIRLIGWQKAFDRVNWKNLIKLFKRNGIDWGAVDPQAVHIRGNESLFGP